MPAGRPALIKTPGDFADRVEQYFALCQAEDRPPTISGAARSLGFADRQSLFDYEAKDEFTCSVKDLRARISEHHESRLSGNNPTGSIFWLKNYGWRDTQELKHSGSVTVAATPEDEDL